MINVRTLAKSALALALAVFGTTTAFAETFADQTVGATVTAENSLGITAGGTLTFTPTIDAADQLATTGLSFETNDGKTYQITVVAQDGGWTFDAPEGSTVTAGTYPVLSFVSADTTAGTGSSTRAGLISDGDVVGAAAPVVTGIQSVAGTATVTLEAAVGQTVVAGSYSAGLTYSLVVP